MSDSEQKEVRENKTSFGSLMVETCVTVGSLILFPALAQRLKVSPMIVNAVRMALNSQREG